LFEEGIKKPNAILKGFKNSKSDLPVPDKQQVSNFLACYKRKKYGNFKLTIGDLQEFVDANSTIPEDQDKAFVGNSFIEHDKRDQTVLHHKTVTEHSTES